MTMLSVDAQIRYLVQWFNEWSELQKSDFLPILTEKYSNKPYVNGITNDFANVNCQEKPMSLFQCRVKLFKEWFAQWNSDQREAFLKKILELDPSFADKIKGEMPNGVDHSASDGEEVLVD